MKPGFRISLSLYLLVLGIASSPAQAVPVIPNVATTTATALSTGQVPDPNPTNFFGVLFTDLTPSVVDDGPAADAESVTSIPSGAETSVGSASAAIDTTDFFGGSTYGASSEVRTSDSGPPTDGPTGFLQLTFNMANQSLAAVDAVLDTTGLIGPGETGTVDAVLNLTGSLIYDDPTGIAAATEVLDIFDPSIVLDVVPEMVSSVSIAFLIADAVDPTMVDPNNPPAASVFSGSATLESVVGGGMPAFSTSGDLDPSQFAQIGTCDAFFCQYDIDISIPFFDIQSLGFGEQFEAGLILTTSVNGVTGNTGADGRRLVSDFEDTASFGISIDVQQRASVPEPSSIALLALGVALMGVARRRAGHNR